MSIRGRGFSRVVTAAAVSLRRADTDQLLTRKPMIIYTNPVGCDPGHRPATIGTFQKTAEQVELFSFWSGAGIPFEQALQYHINPFAAAPNFINRMNKPASKNILHYRHPNDWLKQPVIVEQRITCLLAKLSGSDRSPQIILYVIEAFLYAFSVIY